MNTTDHSTDPGDGWHPPNPRQQAAATLRTEIRRIARDAYGTVWTENPIEGFEVLTRSGLSDPLAGVRAAVLARDVAVGQIRDYAEAARGAGNTWDDIATPLGIDPIGDGVRGELVYGLVVEGRPLPRPAPSVWDLPRAWWTCHACGQRVVDRGPFESHPDDNESGHTDDCPRRAEAMAAFAVGWDDEDQDGVDD